MNIDLSNIISIIITIILFIIIGTVIYTHDGQKYKSSQSQLIEEVKNENEPLILPKSQSLAEVDKVEVKDTQPEIGKSIVLDENDNPVDLKTADKFKVLNRQIDLLMYDYSILDYKLGIKRILPSDFYSKKGLVETLLTISDYNTKLEKYNECKAYLDRINEFYQFDNKYEDEIVVQTFRNSRNNREKFLGGYNKRRCGC